MPSDSKVDVARVNELIIICTFRQLNGPTVRSIRLTHFTKQVSHKMFFIGRLGVSVSPFAHQEDAFPFFSAGMTETFGVRHQSQ
jgi:hypothetical protein